MKRILALLLALSLYGCTSRPSFESFPKIDAHFHLNTSDPAVVQLAKKYDFRLMTLATGSASRERIDRQLGWASAQQRAFPQTVAYATTFSMEHWGSAGWQEQTLAQLRNDFAEGAVAVKVWKDIGMTFRGPDGRFIFIDDPSFEPIFDLIAAEGRTVVGHLGEPRNCWLPIDSMTVLSDQVYFAAHPEYHMYRHPDYPSYEQQIAARDRWLAKHPGLRFVGAHLGSLEWDVDELARRLDSFPNMAVDMAARVCHFQVQDHEKVRRFILRYQDRLLYATDLIVEGGPHDLSTIVETWKNDWRYFTTAETMTSPAVRQPFKGLALPTSVLRKIYYDNAVRWLGGWKPFSAPGQAAGPEKLPSEGPFTFAVVGDSRPGGIFSLFGRTNVNETRQVIIDKIAASNPAFVVNTGDLVKQGSDKKAWREFEVQNKIFKDKNILYCPILGNHDYSGNQLEALANYFECFPNVGKQLWYTLTYANCALVMLDSNFNKLSEEKIASQNKWLEETLARYQADSRISYVIAFFHNPPFTNSTIHKPDKLVQEYFVPRLEACPKVKFAFSGHVHTYERFRVNGINYIVTGGGGSPLDKLPPPGKSRYPDAFDTTGTKPRGTHFCLVTVGKDHIELKTLNLDPQKLTWTAGDDYREEYSGS